MNNKKILCPKNGIGCEVVVVGVKNFSPLPPAFDVQRAVFDVSGIGDGSFDSLSLRTFQ
jgi:hypothetical protein